MFVCVSDISVPGLPVPAGPQLYRPSTHNLAGSFPQDLEDSQWKTAGGNHCLLLLLPLFVQCIANCLYPLKTIMALNQWLVCSTRLNLCVCLTYIFNLCLQRLKKELVPFLTSGSHVNQRDCHPSAVHTLVEGIALCVPSIPIKACALKVLFVLTLNLTFSHTLALN